MIIDKVRAAIKEYGLIRPKDKIVVGVSGGPDSLALLLVLNSLKKEFSFSLHVAHLDHMLRKTSAQDAVFVNKFAAKLGIPVTIFAVNLKKLAKNGSLEEIAREARLGFLLKTAKRVKAGKIALGHNLDDQAETVLMRILRGTGLCGMAGISRIRRMQDIQIIRPLLGVSRKEIEAFLKKRKVKYLTDPTNSEEVFFRNKIRNSLMPLLEKEYQANIKEILHNMAQSSGLDYDYLNRAAQSCCKRLGRGIELKKFLKLHPAMQRLVMRLNIAKVQGNTRRITFRHIREIEDLILNRPVDSVVHLPKGIAVAKKKSRLVFYRR
jgi:tRNA(Ile)-lysidine synthase